MNPHQITILNALVTYAIENIPGGASKDEYEVAQMVGQLALPTKQYNYEVVNTSLHFSGVYEAANAWAERGWRVVGAIGSKGPGYADQIIVERPVWMSHPDD